MVLKLFKTLWGHTGPLAVAADQAVEAGFVGLEGNADISPQRRDELLKALQTRQLKYIQEIITAGGYVPRRGATVEELAVRPSRCELLSPSLCVRRRQRSIQVRTV